MELEEILFGILQELRHLRADLRHQTEKMLLWVREPRDIDHSYCSVVSVYAGDSINFSFNIVGNLFITEVLARPVTGNTAASVKVYLNGALVQSLAGYCGQGIQRPQWIVPGPGSVVVKCFNNSTANASHFALFSAFEKPPQEEKS